MKFVTDSASCMHRFPPVLLTLILHHPFPGPPCLFPPAMCGVSLVIYFPPHRPASDFQYPERTTHHRGVRGSLRRWFVSTGKGSLWLRWSNEWERLWMPKNQENQDNLCRFRWPLASSVRFAGKSWRPVAGIHGWYWAGRGGWYASCRERFLSLVR